jgi:hypothetical protein
MQSVFWPLKGTNIEVTASCFKNPWAIFKRYLHRLPVDDVDIDKADFQVQNLVLETDAVGEVERIARSASRFMVLGAKEGLAPVYTQALQGMMFFL